jgi:hypothetical protein
VPTPITPTPAIDALVASIAAIEAALPAVSPSSATPDLPAYNALVQTILAVWSPLYNLNEQAAADAAAAAAAAAAQTTTTTPDGSAPAP